MLALLFIALLSVVATSVEVEECEPVVCANDDDCYTSQPQDTVTSSAPEWEEPLPGPCQPNPCHHRGVCEITQAHRGDAFLGYLCHCSPGYAGLHCQHNVNECESGPCQNGGVCTDLAANYSCFCPEEFTGRNCQHRCSGPLGMEGGIISDSQLSASSSHGNMFGLQQWHPHLARLHKTGLVNAWSPAQSDRWPWMQVNLRRPMRLTGIITQGARRMGSAEFVKSFKVAYGNNGATWTMLKSKDTLQDIIFSGNTDNNSPMANAFSPPIEAELIRIYPQVCKGHCSLRMELMGCELTGCSEPLGLKAGLVLDSQLWASSVHRTLGMGLLSWEPKHARLDRRGKVNAWSAARNDQKQWIQVDLLAPTKVTGVITQGAKDFGRIQFVGSYKLAYSYDGINWTVYQDENQHADKVFQGNFDNKTHKKNYILPAIFGRFLRLIPWSWYRRITLRMEILGCSEEE